MLPNAKKPLSVTKGSICEHGALLTRCKCLGTWATQTTHVAQGHQVSSVA